MNEQETSTKYYSLHDGSNPVEALATLQNVIAGYFGQIQDACALDGWIAFTIPRKCINDCLAKLKKYRFEIVGEQPTCIKCK